MMSWLRQRRVLCLGVGLLLSSGFELLHPSWILAQGRDRAATITLNVVQTPSGISTRYIGAVEGSFNFDVNDLKDLGINTYRIYGGMSRWEAKDDDGVYGKPTLAEIKANPNRVNWKWWDQVMTYPSGGSDYSWSGQPDQVWKGNARTIFSTLKQAKIRPVLTIRNTDNLWNPAWALQLNPPRTPEDWNEWWAHVFATVYWLNVRNDYQVDEFEIHNEPDNRDQGWGGNQADYFELVRVARDAIAHVYTRYLPGRTFFIHAPVTVGGSRWPFDALKSISSLFTSMNIHDYDADISIYTQRIRQSIRGTAHAQSPLWLGEWGSYTNQYNSVPFGLTLLKNMIRGSQAGDRYIYGSHIFSLYDWGNQEIAQGLIGPKGRRICYYAMRMGIRALQGGRQTFATETANTNVMAMTTQDVNNVIHLIIVNDDKTPYQVVANLSTLITKGRATVWEFSDRYKDEVIGTLRVQQGDLAIAVPANSAILIQLQNQM
jgi:hypothetical protein